MLLCAVYVNLNLMREEKVVICSQGKNLYVYTEASRAVCEYRQFKLNAKASKDPIGKLRCTVGCLQED